ncbi:cbb3-type cytochrome c oxidase subunit II [Mesonia ostreae]|uniref:Cbb3-type cytochrome c oxidase subunit II n=1 Tax=Mesonia ostreae TaxID=861110 RepID=A0ABU2KHM9_9FLAO|nr:cbb3-type cytochrome c oxidase subunit II [Mesonia ostreae]MDT0294215.1 cbb3-type cytochrome c oxidase subunit II [Mesonia ostreae]
MLDFNTNHKALLLTVFGVFAVLSIGVAIIPAFQMEGYEPLPEQEELTDTELKGLNVYISEGCVACHTQQVRNIEMDAMWGDRPSIPEDYVYSKQRLDIWRQSASLLGSERTGPDLTNVGVRQPGAAWQMLHLYNPRAVSEKSIMPSFPWLFEEVDSTRVREDDVVVAVPSQFLDNPNKKIVASEEAKQLVAYLQTLKQHKMPENSAPDFIPFSKIKEATVGRSASASKGLDGKKLFKNNCAACHQDNGKGVPGAFPPLAGSETVNNEDSEKMIRIILEGYNEMEGYGPMQAFADQLTDAEIAAIMNYERNSWGNEAPEVTEEDVRKVRDSKL